MSDSRLRLNASKTQVLWLDCRQTRSVMYRVLSCQQRSTSSTLHATSAMSLTVGANGRPCHVSLSLCMLSTATESTCTTLRSLTDATQTLARAFIASRLYYYCNSVQYGITDYFFDDYSRCWMSPPGWSRGRVGKHISARTATITLDASV